jgi:hypothetical protein
MEDSWRLRSLEKYAQHLREGRVSRSARRGCSPRRPSAQYLVISGHATANTFSTSRDNDGDENFNIYAVDPAAKPEGSAEAPPSRDLTGLKGVRVALYDVPKHKPEVVYVGLNDRDKAWHDLYELKLSTGEKTLLRKNTERISAWTFDLQGNLRLASRSAENGDTEILRVDADKFTKVYSCNVFEQCHILRFAKDGKRAYLVTNKGEDLDLTALELFDPETGKTEMVESDPLKRVDFGTAVFSEASDELTNTNYEDDRVRRYFRDSMTRPISNGSKVS